MKIAAVLATCALTLGLCVAPAHAGERMDEARALLLQGSFDEAASTLEAWVGERPSSPDAEEAASLALALRVRLGAWEHAGAALERTRVWYGATHPDRYLDGALVMARGLLDAPQPARTEEARSLLERAVAFADKAPFLDRRIALRALLGRALDKQDKPRDAKRVRAALVALAKSAPLLQQALWIQEAKDGKAEALFLLGEEERKKVEAVALPPYTGNGDRESVFAYYKRHATQWAPRRYDATAEAERVYARVLDMELPPEPKRANPSPNGGDPNAPIAPLRDDQLGRDPFVPELSPRWAVAAAERVGSMWAAFAVIAGGVPLVRDPVMTPEIRAMYQMIIYEPLYVELYGRAKQAWETCARIATRYRVQSAHTERCFAGLAKRWPAEHRRFEELSPQPVWEGLPVPYSAAATLSWSRVASRVALSPTGTPSR